MTERIKKMMETGKMAPLIEEKFIRLDGTPVDVEVVAKPVFYEGKKAIMVVIHDISESIKVKEELRKSEERYRNLAEASHDMIFVLDREGIISYANTFAAAQFGLKPEQMVGHKREEFFGHSAKAQDVVLNIVFETGEPQYRETRYLFKDKMLWLSTWLVPLKKDDKEVVGILGVSRDISAQKETETELMQLNRKLAESEQNYRGLYESVMEAIYIQDTDGKFLDVNPGAVAMYGYPREWFIGRTPEDVSAPGKNDMEKIKEAVGKAFAGEPQEFEFWGVRSNGQVFPKDVRLYKGKYFDKDVVIALATDITGRKEIEKTRDEFFMIAAHELRAPMTALKWLITMVLDGTYGSVSEEIKKALSGMTDSVDRLINLINDMISVSRIEAGSLKLEPVSFDIKKLTEKLAETFNPEIKSNGLELDIGGVTSLTVFADPDKTAQILSNLIDNAVKFTEKGKISVAAEKSDGTARISISDTGKGVPEAFRSKLFGKFVQVVKEGEEKPKGTGLGLYISRELARNMGRDLVLEWTEEGKGSRFVLTLPVK